MFTFLSLISEIKAVITAIVAMTKITINPLQYRISFCRLSRRAPLNPFLEIKINTITPINRVKEMPKSDQLSDMIDEKNIIDTIIPNNREIRSINALTTTKYHLINRNTSDGLEFIFSVKIVSII
jgi:hypothetical protein